VLPRALTPSEDDRPLDEREREFARALIRRLIVEWQDENQAGNEGG
jgi:hypothetical protein